MQEEEEEDLCTMWSLGTIRRRMWTWNHPRGSIRYAEMCTSRSLSFLLLRARELGESLSPRNQKRKKLTARGDAVDRHIHAHAVPDVSPSVVCHPGMGVDGGGNDCYRYIQL